MSRYLMILSVWGMELTWLYASASFIMTAALGKTFPLAAGVIASGFAMMLTAYTRSFCRRAIQIIGIQLLGFMAVCLRLIYIHENSVHSFFSPHWFIEFLNQPKTWVQWLSLSITLLWLFFFWVGGFKIAKHPKNYFFVRNRFELGVGVFLAILLIELLVIVKTGVHIQGLMTDMLMLPFFIFGMLAFSLIRNSGREQRHFVMGYQGIGTVLSFSAVVLLAGTGMVMFFLPHLTRAAEISFGMIKTAAHPLGPVLVKILLFIFGNRNMASRIGEMPQQSSQPEIPMITEGKENLLYDILGWSFLSIFLLLSVALLFFIMWRLLRWLFSIQTHRKTASEPWNLLVDLGKRIWLVVLSFQKNLTTWIIGPQTAVQLYTALVGWGHFSGLPHSSCETPIEYGSRLGNRFPLLKNEIQLVIKTHSETVYGSDENKLKKLSLARSAIRRLRSPANWPVRLKSLFLH
jgi:hypothetical protein